MYKIKLLMNTYRHATYNLVAHYHFRIAQFDMTISRVLSVVLIFILSTMRYVVVWMIWESDIIVSKAEGQS